MAGPPPEPQTHSQTLPEFAPPPPGDARGVAAAVSPSLPWRIAVVITVLCLAAVVASLARMTIVRGSETAGPGNMAALWPYWIASAATWIGLTMMWVMLRGNRGIRQASFAKSATFIFIIALAARIAVLITHEPGLSDDVYRYIFDGRNLAAGANPYLVFPQDALDRAASAEPERWPGEYQLAPLVTYPKLATPYLPVSQVVFGAIGKTIIADRSDPLSTALNFRIGFTLIELLMIPLLFVALKIAGRSAWWAALYAWHPLPLSEFAGSGHQDIIGIVFLVAALVAFSARPAMTWRWTGLLALSAMGKPFTIPAAAMMLRRRSLQEWLISAATGAIVVAVCFTPFWLIWGDHGRAYLNWKATADELAEKFAHFGGVYLPVLELVRTALPAEGHPAGFNLTQELLARKICLAIFAVIAICIFFSRLSAWQATRAFLFALVLLTTTAHPWYLLWAFALVPMSNSWAIWVLSLTLPWGYAVLGDVVHWTVSPWVHAAAYLPVLVALGFDLAIHRKTRTALPAAYDAAGPDHRNLPETS